MTLFFICLIRLNIHKYDKLYKLIFNIFFFYKHLSRVIKFSKYAIKNITKMYINITGKFRKSNYKRNTHPAYVYDTLIKRAKQILLKYFPIDYVRNVYLYVSQLSL